MLETSRHSSTPHLRFALVREEGLVVPGDARALRVDEDLARSQRYESPIDVHGVLVLIAGGVNKREGGGGEGFACRFISCQTLPRYAGVFAWQPYRYSAKR